MKTLIKISLFLFAFVLFFYSLPLIAPKVEALAPSRFPTSRLRPTTVRPTTVRPTTVVLTKVPTNSSLRCSYCSTASCGQCSGYASGWRCKCSGFNGSTYSSCAGVLDTTCGQPQPTPTGIPPQYCGYCSTAACGQCSNWAIGWRCNCSNKVGPPSGTGPSYYTSCKGVIDPSCGVAQPTPTPPSTYAFRYFCHKTNGVDKTKELYDLNTDYQYGTNITCKQNLVTYWSDPVTKAPLTTGICYKTQAEAVAVCGDYRYFCHKTNGVDRTKERYDANDYQITTTVTCKQNLATHWSDPVTKAPLTTGICYKTQALATAACPIATVYSVRYFCNISTGIGTCGPESTNRLYDPINDFQQGTTITCKQNLTTYWAPTPTGFAPGVNPTGIPLTTGLCYREQNTCTAACPAIRYFCNKSTKKCGPESTNRLYYPVDDRQYLPNDNGLRGPTCAENLGKFWIDPVTKEPLTTGKCYLPSQKAQCDIECAGGTIAPPTPTSTALTCQQMNEYRVDASGQEIDITTNLGSVKYGDEIIFKAKTTLSSYLPVLSMTFQLSIDGVVKEEKKILAVRSGSSWTATYKYKFITYGVHRIKVTKVSPF